MSQKREKEIKYFQDQISERDKKIQELEYLIYLLTAEKYYEC